MTALLIALLTAAPLQAAPLPLATWAQRVIHSSEQPEWKQNVAHKAIEDDPESCSMRATMYSDDDDLDPGTGGGPWAAWGSIRLRWGHCAAHSSVPLGTVFYSPALAHLFIVVDRGPGVRRGSLDIYCADQDDVDNLAEATSNGRLRVYKLGRVSYDAARMR